MCIQKKAAKKTKTTKQGALKRAAKVTRKKASKRSPKKVAAHAKSVPALLGTSAPRSRRAPRGSVEPVRKLARGANVPAGTTVDELTDASHNAL